MILSCSVLLRIKHFSDKSCKKIKKDSLVSKIIYENHALCEMMWEKFVQPDRLKMTV